MLNFKHSTGFGIDPLTNCYSVNYDSKKERTHQHKANESVYVPGAGVEPARFPTGV